MRKLTKLAAAALTALAFAALTATSATADEPFELYTPDAGPCPAVTLNAGQASGGCLTESFEGGFNLGAFTPNWTVVGSYDSTFDLVIGTDGTGYAVNPTIDGGPWGREACDQANGTVLPWAVQARAPDYWTFELDITVGLRTTTSGPGGACTQQQITVTMTEDGPSTYIPQAGEAAELDQTNPSANIADGNWNAPNLGMWILI